ncbi:MAG: protein kinase [Deltaproteobacteria bacterium]|nr:protein kinase [Deltaproteobacteria bacterium]
MHSLASDASADRDVGTEIAGRYRIASLIGENDTGRVYRGIESGALAREVAIRIWADAPPTAVVRFEASALAIAELRHPSTAKLVDSGTLSDGRFFVIRELVHGEKLSHVLAGGPTAPLRILRIVRHIADALIEAHGEGVVHGDLVPSNIFLERTAGREVARLVDFGIAPQTRLPGGDEPVPGRPGYLAPEIIVGARSDHRADLYALGVILFEGLAGRPPFEKEPETPEDPTPRLRLLARHAREPAPLLSQIGCAVDDSLEQLVDRLLSKSPDERPRTALELRDLFDRELLRFELDEVPEPSAVGHAARPTLPADAVEPGPIERTATFGPEDSAPGLTDDLVPAARAKPSAEEISKPTIEISLSALATEAHPVVPRAASRAGTDEVSRPTIEIPLESVRSRLDSPIPLGQPISRSPSIPRARSVSSVREPNESWADARPPITGPNAISHAKDTLIDRQEDRPGPLPTLIDSDPSETLREDVGFDRRVPATLIDGLESPALGTTAPAVPTVTKSVSTEASSQDLGFGPSPSQDSFREAEFGATPSEESMPGFGTSPSDTSGSGREVGFGPGSTDGGESDPAGSYRAMEARPAEAEARFDGEEITSPGEDGDPPAEQTLVTEDPDPQPVIPLLPRAGSLARAPIARDPASRVGGPPLVPAPIPPEGGPIDLRPLGLDLSRPRFPAPPPSLPSIEPPPPITVSAQSSTRTALLLAVFALVFVLVIVVFAVTRFGAPAETTVLPPPPGAIGAIPATPDPPVAKAPPELELLKLRVESNPRYALVTVNGAEVGRTPVVIPAPAPDSALRVEVSLEEFKTYSVDLTVDGSSAGLRADHQSYALLPNTSAADPETHEFALELNLEKNPKPAPPPAKKKSEKKRSKKKAKTKKITKAVPEKPL